MSNQHLRADSPFASDPPLSEAGLARRETMLPVLERAMVARVRRRKVVRMGAVAAIALFSGLAVLRTWPANRIAPGVPPPIIAVHPAPAPGDALAMRYASFHVVQTPLGPSAIVEVDDDTLLRELRAIGHPTGLIRTRGEVILTADIGIKAAGPIPDGS